MSIKVIVQFKVKSTKQAEFYKLMENLKADLPQVAGCEGVLIHSNTGDASNFILTETWQSKKLHEKHVEGLVNTGAWDDILSYLSEEPVSGYYALL